MKQPVQVPQPVLNLFQDFLERHSPHEFSICLRRLLLDYMRRQMRTGFPVHFDLFLWSLSDLFDLLDEAAVQQRLNAIGGKAGDA